jgi:hypothetical protein
VKYLIALLLVACGKSPTHHTDVELLQYTEGFYEVFPNAHKNFAIQWTTTNEGIFEKPLIVGACDLGNGQPLIRLHKTRLVGSSTKRLETIVWHELGHCVLNLNHYDNKLDIMNTTLSSKLINDHYYFLELLYDRIMK